MRTSEMKSGSSGHGTPVPDDRGVYCRPRLAAHPDVDPFDPGGAMSPVPSHFFARVSEIAIP